MQEALSRQYHESQSAVPQSALALHAPAAAVGHGAFVVPVKPVLDVGGMAPVPTLDAPTEPASKLVGARDARQDTERQEADCAPVADGRRMEWGADASLGRGRAAVVGGRGASTISPPSPK